MIEDENKVEGEVVEETEVEATDALDEVKESEGDDVADEVETAEQQDEA